MRKFIAALIAVLTLGSVASTPAFAGADTARPFKASVQSEFFIDGTCNDDTGLLQKIIGNGNASHLGRFHIEGSICLSETPEPGTVTWTAANGDTITIVFVAVIGDVGPDGSATIELVALDATGTGRFTDVEFGSENPIGTVWFADAEGLSGRLEAEIVDGTISYDASDRSR